MRESSDHSPARHTWLHRLTTAALLLALLMAAPGCDQDARPKTAAASSSKEASNSGEVWTTFYPSMWFAQRIAEGKVRVVCPLPAGEDPIFWKPSAEVIAGYQRAALVVVNGAEFEKWVKTAALPISRVVDTAKVLSGNLITFQATTHSHGSGGAHSHVGVDGHTWVDPVNAIVQSEQILIAMVRRWPEHDKLFRDNHAKLKGDLEGLDARLKALSGSMSGAGVLANHPAYNYLARRYGWSVVNVDVDPAGPISDAAGAEIERAVEAFPKGGARVMLFESEPSVEVLATLKSRWNITAVEYSPCESPPASDALAGTNYLTIMNDNITRLAAALGVTSPDATTSKDTNR